MTRRHMVLLMGERARETIPHSKRLGTVL